MKHGGDWEQAGTGITRRISELGKQIMAVRVRFEIGAVGALHHHPHEQLIVVASGKFKFSLGGQEKTLQAGETLYIPSNLEHGTVALETGELIDIFTPLRLDFLDTNHQLEKA